MTEIDENFCPPGASFKTFNWEKIFKLTQKEKIVFLLFSCNNYQYFVILFSFIPPTTYFLK